MVGELCPRRLAQSAPKLRISGPNRDICANQIDGFFWISSQNLRLCLDDGQIIDGEMGLQDRRTPCWRALRPVASSPFYPPCRRNFPFVSGVIPFTSGEVPFAKLLLRKDTFSSILSSNKEKREAVSINVPFNQVSETPICTTITDCLSCDGASDHITARV